MHSPEVPPTTNHQHSVFSITTKQSEQESTIDESVINSLNHINVNNFLILVNTSSSKVTIEDLENTC